MALREELRRPGGNDNLWCLANFTELKSDCKKLWHQVNSCEVLSKDVQRLAALYHYVPVVTGVARPLTAFPKKSEH
jgi:hypothetical protein